MANRLCFDLGLHLDCQNDGLDEKDVQIRHMTLFACVIYDKYVRRLSVSFGNSC